MVGIIQDITEHRIAEQEIAEMEQMRIKEIHHRIKNNLQVISSMLDLQAEKFSQLKSCECQQVIDAFNDSKHRVISMALIHEDLYRGLDSDLLDFAAYLRDCKKPLYFILPQRK